MLRVIHLTKDAIKKGALTALLLLPIVSSAQIEYEIDSYLPFDNLQDLIVAILRIFVTIATPIIVLFIIYAGFKYVTAQGNAQQVQEATRALTYAIIGAVLILGAVAISEIIANTIGAFQP